MASNLLPPRRSVQTYFTVTVCCTLFVTLVLAHDSSLIVTKAPAPAPATAVPAPAPAPKVLTLHEKVVGALRAAGHYGAISGLLDSLSDTIIKEGTTLFAPDDSAFNGVLMNSSSLLVTMLNYHVATKVYNYQALTNLPVGTRLQTAAPGVVIVVTSNVKGAYKLDNAGLVDPDIYSDSTVSVHGLNAVLDTASYNKGVVAPEAAPAPAAAAVPPPAPGVAAPKAATKTPAGQSSNHNGGAHTTTNLFYNLLAVASIWMAMTSL